MVDVILLLQKLINIAFLRALKQAQSINRGGHFLLTEVVTETTSQNTLTEAVTFNSTALVNTPILLLFLEADTL